MQNLEFKAELRDIALARQACLALRAKRFGAFQQRDTYFKMPDGRLKKRETASASHATGHQQIEWILYHRADCTTPKVSTYTILSDRQAATRWGTHGLKPWVTVKKRREMWMLDTVRIHLDDVHGLGRFLEFEAAVCERYNVRECRMIIQHLRERFAPALGEPISASYSDLATQDE